jgi:maltose O-acetyltransferase
MAGRATTRGEADDMIVHLKNVVLNVFASIYWLPVSWRVALMRSAGVSVGEGTIVRSRCYFGGPGPFTIGAGCYVSYGADFDGSAPVTIGDDVYVASGVSVGTCTHDIGEASKRAGRRFAAAVSIGDGTWVGMNSTILPGVTIGSGCVIAAGAVVAHDCDPNGLYAGVPAKLVDELGPGARWTETPEPVAAV